MKRTSGSYVSYGGELVLLHRTEPVKTPTAEDIPAERPAASGKKAGRTVVVKGRGKSKSSNRRSE